MVGPATYARYTSRAQTLDHRLNLRLLRLEAAMNFHVAFVIGAAVAVLVLAMAWRLVN
jgi:hypothetical protein